MRDASCATLLPPTIAHATAATARGLVQSTRAKFRSAGPMYLANLEGRSTTSRRSGGHEGGSTLAGNSLGGCECLAHGPERLGKILAAGVAVALDRDYTASPPDGVLRHGDGADARSGLHDAMSSSVR